MDFSENTYKNFYYSEDHEEPSDEEGTLAFKVKKAMLKRTNDIDDFFETPKKKKKFSKKLSSSVSKSLDGGVSYITSNKDDDAYASHLIKIEIVDLHKVKNIPPADQWKHADVRVKYFVEVEEDQHLKNVKDIIFNITKQIATKEDCVKYCIENKKN